jgi:uncharacterized damage-inducible protein DinB
MDTLDILLDHDRWATRVLLKASEGLTEAQLDQRFDIGHGTLRETFGHIIFNIPFWSAFLEGRSTDGVYSADNQPEDRSIAALIDHHESSYAAFAAIVRRLRDENRLGEVYADHYGVKKTFGGTILMVNQHDAEHRTEIAHILARLGVDPVPEVDLGVWEYYQLNN